MVATICGVFFINLCVMIVMSICGLRRKLYLRKLKREHERRLKEGKYQISPVSESKRHLTTVEEDFNQEHEQKGVAKAKRKEKNKSEKHD